MSPSRNFLPNNPPSSLLDWKEYKFYEYRLLSSARAVLWAPVVFDKRLDKQYSSEGMIGGKEHTNYERRKTTIEALGVYRAKCGTKKVL